MMAGLLLVATLGCGPNPELGDGVGTAEAAVVTPPSNGMVPPANIFVLPVFLVPTDMSTTYQAGRTRARRDISIALHVARKKYEAMLKNPLTGALRGTFRVASWTGSSASEITTPPSQAQQIEPLVVNSPCTAQQLRNSYNNSGTPNCGTDYDYVKPILDAAGCAVATGGEANCPFVLATVVVAPVNNPVIGGAGGRLFNIGSNNGAGVAFFDFQNLISIDQAGSTSTFLSTLLHELGHAFGLHHVSDYGTLWSAAAYNPANDNATFRFNLCNVACPSSPSYCCTPTATKKPSIMSYARGNWIYGCGRTTPPTTSGCVYPGDTAAAALPGILMPEDLRLLGLNRRAFPLHRYERGVDAPNKTVYFYPAATPTLISGEPRVSFVGSDPPQGVSPPAIVLGGDDVAFAQYFESFHDSRSLYGTANYNMKVTLPAPATLNRVDVYTGVDGTLTLSSVTLVDGQTGVTLDRVQFANDNQALTFQNTTTGSLNLSFSFFSGVAPVIRGIRLFGVQGGAPTEFYPAGEPRVVDAASSSGPQGIPALTLDGSVANIGGDAQYVESYSAPWTPAHGWHSVLVGGGNWVSLLVDFPEEVELGYVLGHTGYGSTLHAAQAINVERRCICGSADATGCTSTSGGACATPPADGGVFEQVIQSAPASPDQLINFAAKQGRTWKIAFQAHTAAQQPSNPGYVVVRGLRFFAPSGVELFPARSTP